MSNQCVSAPAAYASSKAAGASSAEPGPWEAITQPMMEGLAMTAAIEPQAQTKEVLMSEVRYGIVFGSMNEEWNGRADKWLKTFSYAAVALTATGLLSVFSSVAGPSVTAIWTAAWAILGALAWSSRRGFEFEKREDEFKKAKKAFQTLEGKGWGLSREQLAREIAKLRNDAPAGGQWLAPLAYNKACRELGYPEKQMPVPCVVHILAPGM